MADNHMTLPASQPEFLAMLQGGPLQRGQAAQTTLEYICRIFAVVSFGYPN